LLNQVCFEARIAAWAGRRANRSPHHPRESENSSLGEGWQAANARASASGKPGHPGNQRGGKEPSLWAAETGGEG